MLHQAERIRQLWNEAVTELQATKAELTTLYRVSTVLRESVELEDLYKKTLEIVADLRGRTSDGARGIFLVQRDALTLVAQTDPAAGFAEAHAGMKVGTCLCGLAAARGEVVTTEECAQDPRRALARMPPQPHGHAIIPLKAHGRVVGVLYTYPPAHTRFEDRQVELFRAIGDQIGIAIENAQLYEERRQAALHDPLTGLDNRRGMRRGSVPEPLADAWRDGYAGERLRLLSGTFDGDARERG